MLWNTLPGIIKSAKMTGSLKTELKIGRDPHAVFKYISIVNRKSSWLVLVFNYSFCSQL